MKKWLSMLIAVMLVLQFTPMAFAADGGTFTAKTQSAAGLAILPGEADVQVGGSITLEAALPDNTPAQDVLWASGNTSVATVTSAGVVTGIQPGAAVITATANNGGGQAATCVITVKPVATGITLNKAKATVGKGKTLQLKASVMPDNAYSGAIIWASSAEKVATVSSTGEVLAKKTGKAAITATDTASGQTATCKITVAPVVKKVKLSYTKTVVGIGRTFKLKATATPSNAANKKITWTSSNTKVATVNSKGKITAKGKGKATITVSAANGKSAKIKVTVKK